MGENTENLNGIMKDVYMGGFKKKFVHGPDCKCEKCMMDKMKKK